MGTFPKPIIPLEASGRHDRWDDPEPDTLRACEACDQGGCPWCHNGLQTRHQIEMWHDFRTKMRHVSNTYSFLEEVVLDLLKRLGAIDSDEALVLALEGQRLLERWGSAKYEDGGRKETTEALKSFNRRVLDYLQGIGPGG